ncbi:MAG: LCP family protein [Defluviitaleaceae bacterium]|nr:LCP family protein [Defluviitaleaceae bacterium]
MRELQAMPRNVRKRLLIKFFTIVLGGVGSFVLMFNVAVLAFFIPPSYSSSDSSSYSTESTGGGGMADIGARWLDNINQIMGQQAPVRTSFLIAGVDNEDGGADVIIMGVFNRLTGNIDLINIPRDTFMVVSDPSVAILRENNRVFNNPTKATDLFRHSGQHGAAVMSTQLEEWLNIEINYYVKVDLVAFKNIVDIIGGVYFNVPQRMFYNNYHDAFIDLHPGYQLLNGQQAEGLVRFRGYARADMQRIEVQQDFMRALFSQVLQRDILFSLDNVIALLETVLTYVETDFPISSIAMYMPYLPNLSADSLRTQTMPGDPGAWHASLGSIVQPFMGEFTPIINQVFHGIYPPEPEQDDALAGTLTEGS